MGNYDAALRVAKSAVTEAIVELSRDTPKLTIMDFASRIDDLNKAWDELTDALVRQRNVREDTIEYLHGVIAELKKR